MTRERWLATKTLGATAVIPCALEARLDESNRNDDARYLARGWNLGRRHPFGESSNEKNDVQHDIFNLKLTNTDGSHVVVHDTTHLSTNALGVVTVNFEKMSVSCAG